MKLGRILLFLVVALPMLLVGYQLVELEIIPQAAVELTPGAPIESEPQIQLVAPQIVALEDYNDDAALEVILAYPHVLFQHDQTTVMPFEQGTDATYYLVGDRDQCVRGQCLLCDSADNQGCDAASDAPICRAGRCERCNADAECPEGSVCLGDGRCTRCEPGTNRGCPAADLYIDGW